MVTKMWGKADSFELVFSPIDSSCEKWMTSVPADLDDGQYIVELYCSDDGGNIAYWTGILYLNNSSNVEIRIVADGFRLWLESDFDIELQSDLKVGLIEDSIRLTMACIDYIFRG